MRACGLASDTELLDPLRKSYRDLRRVERDGSDPALATAVRLAADGLWFADLLGLAAGRGLRERLLGALVERGVAPMRVGVFVILFLAVAAEISRDIRAQGYARLHPAVARGSGRRRVRRLFLSAGSDAAASAPRGRLRYLVGAGHGRYGIVGELYRRESLDLAGAVGIARMVVGVAVLNLFCGATAH